MLADQLVKQNSFTFRGRSLPFDADDAEEAIRKLVPETPKGLLTTNQETYDNLLLGTTIAKTIEGHTRSYSMQYIDWPNLENNVFHVTAEYRVERSGAASSDRLDIVAFVNGIPFIVIENNLVLRLVCGCPGRRTFTWGGNTVCALTIRTHANGYDSLAGFSCSTASHSRTARPSNGSCERGIAPVLTRSSLVE